MSYPNQAGRKTTAGSPAAHLIQRPKAAAVVAQSVNETRGVDLTNLEGIQYQTHALKGDAADVIIKTASRFDVDLIVMGTVGRVGISGIFIGNTAETVLNNTRCSVLTLKPREFQFSIT